MKIHQPTEASLEFEGLPGADLVRQGLADIDAGLATTHALLLMAAPGRLSELGVPISSSMLNVEEPELALYEALCDSMTGLDEDPYYRYNSWRRELDSFISALESRRRWQRMSSPNPT